MYCFIPVIFLMLWLNKVTHCIYVRLELCSFCFINFQTTASFIWGCLFLCTFKSPAFLWRGVWTWLLMSEYELYSSIKRVCMYVCVYIYICVCVCVCVCVDVRINLQFYKNIKYKYTQVAVDVRMNLCFIRP